MKGKLLLAVIGATASLAVAAGPAGADPDANHSGHGVTSPVLLALITDDDVFSTVDLSTLLDPPPGMGTPTQHYGPYPSTSPDSGTCGNDWATDTFNREFTVRTDSSGTITIVEQFKQGSFVTNAGPSPGGCETNLGGTITAGKTGSMHGYFIIPLLPGTTQTSNSPYCDAVAMTNTGCTTFIFISTHFSSAVYDVTTFFFHYAAGDQSLLFHEWKNASPDRGGNSGDIANT
jgi:hypothetical protein